jgi:hypothetical protein
MAPKKPLPGKSDGGGKKRRNKAKQPQAKTPMQRVVVIGPTGKRRLEWRPWA